MSLQKVGIMTECICDLTKKYLKEHNIGVLYFLVKTESGVFTDTDEITAENILGYMNSTGNLPVTSPPTPEAYEKFFRENLGKYEEIIFVTTGSGASESYKDASAAVSGMGSDGERVHIFDSKHLSTGLGHVVIKAAEMAAAGSSAKEILAELDGFRDRVSTTFIAMNADYLYRNGRVPLSVKKLCDLFGIHPILMMKDGTITLKSVMFGNYEKAGLRYVRSELKKADDIDRKRIFITHVGCSMSGIEKIKNEVNRKCRAEDLTVTKASATISCNCGPGTFGVLFVKEKRT